MWRLEILEADPRDRTYLLRRRSTGHFRSATLTGRIASSRIPD